MNLMICQQLKDIVFFQFMAWGKYGLFEFLPKAGVFLVSGIFLVYK